MSAERLTNYIIFVIMDSMMEAFEKGIEDVRLQFLEMRSKPECITYVYNWVHSHKKFLRRSDIVIHNPELERLVMDGVRLCHAHYYSNDKIQDGTSTSVYAKECSNYYKEDIANRKEVEDEAN